MLGYFTTNRLFLGAELLCIHSTCKSGKLNWNKEEIITGLLTTPLLVDGLLYYGTSILRFPVLLLEGCKPEK